MMVFGGLMCVLGIIWMVLGTIGIVKADRRKGGTIKTNRLH